MATCSLLYFTSEDHYLYTCSRSGLELEAKFSSDDLGVTEFREYLRTRRNSLFAIVADLTGEDFHEDHIPYLRGGDRQAVVQRRLAQRYRDTRLAAAFPLGHVNTGERRNERLLLASFTNTQQFAPWLDALEESEARLTGVYSVPLLAPSLAARLGAKRGRCLVVTANRAGLRQCFVEDGLLRFARLERTVEMVPQALAMFVRSETLRLAQYLVTLRALPREGAPVQVLVVAPPGKRPAFEQALTSDARLVFKTIDALDALAKVGLRRLPEGMASEGLYLHLAARKPPREQFASNDDRRRYRLWQLQRRIVAAGALACCTCGIYAGSTWLKAVDVRAQAAVQEREARSAADDYQRITAAFPVTQTSTENVRVTVVEFQQIAQRTAMPESDFVHVSRVLEQFPEVEIDGIRWSVDTSVPRTSGAPATSIPASPSANAAAVQLEISGRVNTMQRDDYRGITAEVQRFAAALGRSGYEVRRTTLPFDITSEGTLTGDIGSRPVSTEAPRFTVLISRKAP